MELFAVGVVNHRRFEFHLLFVGVAFAGDIEVGGEGEVEHGAGPFCRLVDDGAEEPVAELVHHDVALPDDVGADNARVGAVDEDALVFQFVGEVKGEVEEGQFGVGVGAEPVELLLVHGGEDVVVDFAVADGE